MVLSGVGCCTSGFVALVPVGAGSAGTGACIHKMIGTATGLTKNRLGEASKCLNKAGHPVPPISLTGCGKPGV